MYLRLASLLLLASCCSVYGQFSNGASQDECESLAPSTSTPATGTPPFIVVAIPPVYDGAANVTLQVFIASISGIRATGLVLQARRTSSNADNTPVGRFSVPDDYRLLTCGSSPAGTITNVNSNEKSLAFPFMWNNEGQNFGTIQFIVSLTDINGQFWSNVVSETNITSTAGELVQLSIANCTTRDITGSVATWTPPDCFRDSEVQSQAMCVPPSGTTLPAGMSTSICTCSDRAESAQCNVTLQITPVSACMPNPCNNGGTCIEVPGFGAGFVCQCPAGLPQPTCGDTVTNTPPTLTCPSASLSGTAPAGSNQAVVFYNPFQCTDTQDGVLTATCNNPSGTLFSIGTTPVTCVCTDSGSLSSTCNFNVIVSAQVSACMPNPCNNGGTCIEVPGFGAGFFCQCPTGLPQPTCGVPVDACNPNPCQNGGICSPSGTTFTCQCLGSFSGPTCTQTPGDPCVNSPCLGNECRISATSLAGYTCHSVTGVPCITVG